MVSVREPDFFIAGAPKCGTTTLYGWLRAHPDVYMPELKEPHYHSTDLPGLREVKTPEAYCALFAAAPPDALLGEASASYFQSGAAVPRILESRPEARFVVILRDPVEMAHAMHGEKFANLSEDVEDFEEAWRVQWVRAEGERVPLRVREPRTLQYEQVCAIGAQLERFMARVPEDQRLVLLMDDLRANPGRVHARLLAFLGLRSIPLPDRAPANASHRLRSRRLAELHRDLPHILGGFYRPAKRLGNAIGLSPSAILSHINTQRAPRSKLSPAFEAELRAVFGEEVARVEQLLGRDLSHWRTGSSA